MIQWKYTPHPLSYEEGEAFMKEKVNSIVYQQSPEIIWGLQHLPVYTAGTSAKLSDLKDPGNISVYKVGRGGSYTYHGPGQLVVYCLLRLSRYQNDIHLFIYTLETWIQKTLEEWGIFTTLHKERTGLWVGNKKIVSIGIRISRGISFHGFAMNIHNDLKPFEGITPCGLQGYGVTSLKELGVELTCVEVWEKIKKTNIFEC